MWTGRHGAYLCETFGIPHEHLSGTFEGRRIPLQFWDQFLVRKHPGDLHIPTTIPQNIGRSHRVWTSIPTTWFSAPIQGNDCSTTKTWMDSKFSEGKVWFTNQSRTQLHLPSSKEWLRNSNLKRQNVIYSWNNENTGLYEQLELCADVYTVYEQISCRNISNPKYKVLVTVIEKLDDVKNFCLCPTFVPWSSPNLERTTSPWKRFQLAVPDCELNPD